MPPVGSIPSSRARREFRSPLTLPTVSSGTVTSSDITRLEKHWVGGLVGLFEGHCARDLEGHLGRIDVVVLAVDQPDPHP